MCLRAHKRPSKRRQKSITLLARKSPDGGQAEAKGQEAVPGGLREASVSRLEEWLAGSPKGLLAAGKGTF